MTLKELAARQDKLEAAFEDMRLRQQEADEEMECLRERVRELESGGLY